MKKLAAVSLLLAVAACSAHAADPAPPTAGGPTPSGTTPDGGPGSASDAGATPDGGGDPAPVAVKSGTVTLTQSTFTAGPTTINSYTAFASFFEGTSTAVAAVGASCKQSTDGDCSLMECNTAGVTQPDAGATDAGAVTPPAAPNAGKISIAAMQSFDLLPGANGTYAAKTGQVQLFAAGADIQVTAAGDTVPAFAKTLKGPSTVTLTAPAWPTTAGQALVIDRSAALPLTWTGGTDGDVAVSLTSTLSPNTTIITCKFAANAGSGSVSAAAIGKLVATDTGSISISAVSSDAFEQDGWKINVSASTPAKAGASVASGLAKIH